MKSLGRKTLRQKVEIETEKYMKENYEKLAYYAVAENAHYIAEQVEATMLLVLQKRGYGAKRLQEVHKEFVGLISMPDVFGKIPQAEDCMKLMSEKYGIDFSEVKPRFMEYEQYKKAK